MKQQHTPSLFTARKLLGESLRHGWRVSLTVMLAAAVGVAVLTGSLLVGASVRGSLRDLALARLGRVGQMLTGEALFREKLAGAFPKAAPVMLLPGSASHAGSGARASKVQALGITEAFWKLDGIATSGTLALGEDQAVLNAALARQLGARVGDDVILRVQKPSAIPRESFVGQRNDTIVTLRLTVARIAGSPSLADFSPAASQFTPFNIFVPLATLQRRVGQPGLANTLLADEATTNAQAILKQSATLEDAGLSFHPYPNRNYLSVESSRIFIPPALAELTTQSAAELLLVDRPTLTYLANTLKVGGRTTPYSTVAALDDLGLKPGEIALTDWLAEDLGAKPGDRLAIAYYAPAAAQLTETTATLTVSRIVQLTGPWVDPGLTPDFPGIRQANRLSAWRPPFPLDMKRIRPKDEAWWDRFRAAPKAFVSLATGRALWKNPYGDCTSIRVFGADERQLRAVMTTQFSPERAGLNFMPLRARALSASQGASDFGGLFIGFSFFLLVAAAMLIRVLFQLGVQARAREFGLLGAVGFTPKKIRRLMLAEGALVAAGGGLLGVALGVGYAALMLHGLRTWWVGAIGTPFLALHVDAVSLTGGFFGGWLVALFAVWLAARRLSREPARALLSGRSVEEGFGRARSRLAVITGLVFLVLGIGLAAAAPALSAQEQAGIFFGAGAALLIAALIFFRVWLRRPPRASQGATLTLTRLSVLAARRRPGRSMLVTGLMACAVFIIVAVGANRHTATPTTDKHSGAGGFTLLAESSAPLYKPLDPATLKGARAFALRLRPGDDASCLNLYKAARPRILGVPKDFIQRGGFLFAQSIAKDPAAKVNPWLLLERPLPDGAVPAIGDFNSVVWLLHSGLGKEVVIDGHRLRFVALLQGSVFQSELIVSETSFKRLFPAEAGWRFFAIEAPPAAVQTLAAALESKYEEFGLDATPTAERLNDLMQVENTYLATFQALGGLGLLLGTLGMALALLRNLLERRAELALLRAVGLRGSQLLWMTVAENVLLIAVGLFAGTACALVAVLPAVASRAAQAPWVSLALTVLGVFVFGAAATALSAAAALKAPLIRALKAE